MNINDEFLYNTFIDTSDESSDDDSDIMLAAATLIHNFNEAALPRHAGSFIGRASALDRDRENGHYQLWKDYFNPVRPTYHEHIFRRHFRMARVCSCVYWKG